MIEITEVKKNFGSHQVLKGLSLKIENGKVTSIVGKNGAGKSTLIALIADYKAKNEGEIVKQDFSVMPDADNLFRDMKGLYFLKFMAQLKGASVSTDEIFQLADRLFLSRADLSKKLKNYSFGMKKKISFLQAYLGDFDTYIFDEPTSGIDVEAEKAMMELILELRAKGKAVLLTSHNIEEIERYSDYVYILENGLISLEGTVEHLTEGQGELENYHVLVAAEDEGICTDIIVDWGYRYQFDPQQNKFRIENISKEEMRRMLKLFFDYGVLVDGYWAEKRNLRDVIFQETVNEERKDEA